MGNEDGRVDFDLGLLIVAIRKSLLWMLLVFALAFGGAYTYLYFTQPVYESSTIIQIITDDKANRLLDVENIYESQDISKQIELLRLEEFFKRVIESLELYVSYYNEGEVLTHEHFRNAPYEVKFRLLNADLYDKRLYIDFEDAQHSTITYALNGSEFTSDFQVNDTMETPHMVYMIEDRSIQSILDQDPEEDYRSFFMIKSDFNNLRRLYPNYRVKLLNGSAKTVRVTVKNTNRLKASTIADRITEEFIVYDKERLSEGALQILEFIDSQLSEVYGRLKDSEVVSKNTRKTIARLKATRSLKATWIA